MGPDTAQFLLRLSPAAQFLLRLSPGSRHAQSCALRHIEKWLLRSDGQKLEWHKISAADVLDVRARAVERLAPATARRYMAALRGVLKECWRAGLIDAERLARLIDVPPIRGSRPPPGRSLSPAEIGQLRYTAEPRDRAVLAALVGAGLRRAEVQTARLEHDSIRVLGKGDKVRNIVILGRVLADITACPPPWPLSGPGVWAMLRRLGRRSGVGRFSPHDLRRTYASIALGAGVDLATLQVSMGHASPTVTARYDRRSDAQTTAAEKIANALD